MTHLSRELSGLLDPGAYPHAVGDIDVVETHISWVFLTGTFAYKVKRPVRHAFIDLRAPETRLFFCREEVRLNRRFAPDLYEDVCNVTASGRGEVRIDGAGPVIEHAVRMRQFRRDDELDRLLAAGAVEPEALRSFGRDLADIHARLPVAAPEETWGHPSTVRRVVVDNVSECARAVAAFGLPGEVASLRAAIETRLDAGKVVMTARIEAGRVRECHGDLHAGNVVRIGSRLVAFDCMEFEPGFRWIDVAEEIAFLAADLDARGFPSHGHAFLSGYLEQSGDFAACRLLRLYRAHRALVRAKIAALRGTDMEDGPGRDSLRAHCADCIRVAGEALAPARPALVLVSGLSGVGKTRLSEQVAPRLGAVHLRSDVERKRLAGLAGDERVTSEPGEGLYSREMSDHVYERLARCAADVVAGGYTAVVDASFIRRVDRERFSRVAGDAGVEACLVQCHAPRAVVERRIEARRASGNDASDATVSILRWQERHAEPVANDEKFRTLDADTTDPGVVDAIVQAIAGSTGDQAPV